MMKDEIALYNDIETLVVRLETKPFASFICDTRPTHC